MGYAQPFELTSASAYTAGACSLPDGEPGAHPGSLRVHDTLHI
jgi:hypothetical protein